MKVSTPHDNNEGINILMLTLVKHVGSLVAAPLVSNKVINLRSAAHVVEESARQEEVIHVEGVVDATFLISPL